MSQSASPRSVGGRTALFSGSPSSASASVKAGFLALAASLVLPALGLSRDLHASPTETAVRAALLRHPEVQAWVVSAFRLPPPASQELGVRLLEEVLASSASARESGSLAARLRRFEGLCSRCGDEVARGLDPLASPQGAAAFAEAFGEHGGSSGVINLGAGAHFTRESPASLGRLGRGEGVEGAHPNSETSGELSGRAGRQQFLRTGRLAEEESATLQHHSSSASRGEAGRVAEGQRGLVQAGVHAANHQSTEGSVSGMIPMFDFASQLPQVSAQQFFSAEFLDEVVRVTGSQVRLEARVVPLAGLPGGATARSIRIFARVNEGRPFFTLSVYRERSGRVWLDSLRFESPVGRPEGAVGSGASAGHQLEGVPQDVWNSLRSGISSLLRAMGATEASVMRFSRLDQWQLFRSVLGNRSATRRVARSPSTLQTIDLGTEEFESTLRGLANLRASMAEAGSDLGAVASLGQSRESFDSFLSYALRSAPPSAEALSAWTRAMDGRSSSSVRRRVASAANASNLGSARASAESVTVATGGPEVTVLRDSQGRPMLLTYLERPGAVPAFGVVDPVHPYVRGGSLRLLSQDILDARFQSMGMPAWETLQ